MKTDIDNLWNNFDSLLKRVAAAEKQLSTQAREHDQAISALRESIEKRVKESKAEVKEAVMGNPFSTLIGLWVVAVSTFMQLVLATTH